jgi:hypothetical protein
MFTPLSQTNWQTLQGSPQVWDSSITYPKGALVRAVSVSTSGSFSDGVWTPGGWQLYRALKSNENNNPLTQTTDWAPLVGIEGQFAPSVYQAYYQAANGQYVAGIQPWNPTTSFYTGQYAIDNSGNLELAVVGGTTSPTVNVANAPNAVVISGNVLTLMLSSGLASMGLVAGVSSLTIYNFSFATFLNGLTLPVVAINTTSSPNTVSLTYTHANYNSDLQNESNASIRVGFSTSTSVPTYDGTVLWEYLGSNYLNTPAKWIQVVDSTNNPTSEVSNWDVNHPMGLLSPRTDLCWEISGGDFFQSYTYE